MKVLDEDLHDRPARSPARPSRAGGTLLLCLSTAWPFAHAAERDLGAHEHGVAALDVVLDGTHLYLDLESPADNVLGFEHAPSTDTQRTRVAEAEAVLDADGIFVPDAAAGCVFEQSTLHIALPGSARRNGEDAAAAGHDASGRQGEHDAHASDEDGDKDGDEDQRAAEQVEDHRDEHDDEHEDEAGHGVESSATRHADIVLGHVLVCENPESLSVLRTTLFDRFGGFAEIAVRLVGPGGQDGARMTPDDPAVSLEPIL